MRYSVFELRITQNNIMKTLQLLKDYASTKDNAWLTNQLLTLEHEIKIAILEAEINEINKMKTITNKVLNA